MVFWLIIKTCVCDKMPEISGLWLIMIVKMSYDFETIKRTKFESMLLKFWISDWTVFYLFCSEGINDIYNKNIDFP